ncbi:MAG TPA: serine/threonine-protein kinase, partial [Chthoniobacteraceae bacterium]|nr:serine/threonine-protein kinase [Chthoniobacteraceae bacterium]
DKSPHSPEIERELARLKPEEAGDRIGPYKLREQIGEGGFGSVWVAEQEHPVRRRVALKIIKLGMDTKEVIARFEQERQALALMDHPNIAKVLDAGATQYGRPFFVMELVRGLKITDYCDDKKLSTPERLELFITVCQAVQHAHQKGIIHRDLKPSNILVAINDGKAVPKVIDFGVAKATQGRLTEQTVYTQFQQMIGTPLYMSPEQAELTSLDIDTRSDIYSLGVLLYELLTGHTPIEQETLARVGMDEVRRIIREVEPPRPSIRLKTLAPDELTTTAKRRHIEPAKLPALLRGDLDWIVMKCLEKDRGRRYETANGLAIDIERHLHNEPVVARPPSRIYRFQKLVRRNKLAVGAALAVAAALVLGAFVSVSQAIRAIRAEAAALHSQKQAEAMNRFLTEDLLYQATPDENASEKNVTMKEVLEKAARKLDHGARIANEPELEARLRLAVGNTYFKLGILGEAERHLRRAVALRSVCLGPRHEETLAAQETLAWFLVGGLKSPEGEQLSRETWQGRRQVLGPEHRDTLDSMDTYGTSLTIQKKYEEAESIYRECLEIRRRVLGTNDKDYLVSLGNLGQLLSECGKLADAERVVRDVIDRRILAGLGNTTDTFANINNLAWILFSSDRLDDAERLLSDACPRAIQLFSPENPVSTLRLQQLRARVLAGLGRFPEAEKLATETLAIHRRIASTHEGTARTLFILGRVKVEKGDLDEAGRLLSEALDLFREHSPSRREQIALAANWLGAIKVAREAYSDAEKLLLTETEQFFAPAVQMSNGERRAAVGHIVQLYESWKNPQKAATWKRRLDDIPDRAAK